MAAHKAPGVFMPSKSDIMPRFGMTAPAAPPPAIIIAASEVVSDGSTRVVDSYFDGNTNDQHECQHSACQYPAKQQSPLIPEQLD